VTLNMPDSIYPANLPGGYPAYLGYVDGTWNTAPRLRALFPGARYVTLTVFGTDLQADGADCEPGNVNAAGAAGWVKRKLAADPGSRPVVYADLESPGYTMSDVLGELAKAGISADRVRKLTAHYHGEHICSPSRGCRDANGNVITFTADGTQWTDTFPGVGGAAIDMSLLADDFFSTVSTVPTQLDWTEQIMQQLPVLQQGATGTYVRTVQFQLGEHGHPVKVDGALGPVTEQALRAFQAASGITADGVVGPQQTWPKLLGV
jgi:hypothetical protein